MPDRRRQACFRRRDYRRIRWTLSLRRLDMRLAEDGYLIAQMKLFLRLKCGIIRDAVCLHASGPYYARLYGHLDREVEKAVAKLSRMEVVRVRHSVGVDSTGEPAIFFRIVLTDSASKADVLAEITARVSATLFDEVRPHENWGLIPYFSFRSKSEQDKRNEPEWA